MMRTLLAAVLATALVGCVKKPGDKDKTIEDFGPEISEKAFEAELDDDRGNRPDPLEIRKGDSALLVHQQVIEREQVTVDKTLSVVIDRQETEKDITYNWKTTREEWRNGQAVAPTTDKGYSGSVLKPATTALGRALDSLMKPFGLSFSFFTESKAAKIDLLSLGQRPYSIATRTASDTALTFHNFKRSPIKVKIPDLARQQPNCGRRNPGGCDVPISGEKISWDVVVWKEGKPVQKVSNLRIISSELPFFWYETPNGSGFDYFYMNCSEGIVDIQTQKVHVIDCWLLADFALDSPPAASPPAATPTPTPTPVMAVQSATTP